MTEKKKKPLENVWPIAGLFIIILVVGISYFTSPKFDHKYSEKEKTEMEYSKKRKESQKLTRAEETRKADAAALKAAEDAILNGLNFNDGEKECIGTSDCIYQVKQKLRGSKKRIVMLDYAGGGKFFVMGSDLTRNVDFEAIYYTDCNCKIIDVDMTIKH